jgi:hypothetical protein
VVFDVAGQINLTSEVSISNPYLTIAGQTAPGAGVTIAGESVSFDTHDVIVRYVRFRRGNITRADDALGSDRTNNNYQNDTRTGHIIIDHVSASWGLDENLSVYRNKLDAPLFPGPPASSTVFPTRNVTVQWSISSEALNPNNHAFGSTLGGAGVNQHHNLWASNTARNPSISFSHFMDFRNNVLFNWQHRSVDGAGPEAHVNMINNYYKAGPATNSGQLQYRIVKPELRDGVVGFGEAGWWYVEGNYVNGNPTVTADNWNGGVQFDLPGMQQSWVRVTTPHTHVEFPDDPDDPFDDDGSGSLPGSGNPLPIPDLPTIATQSAQGAFASVLAGAGASLVRDAVDIRVTNMVATGVVSGTANGIINNPSQVGGYPTIPFEIRDANWDADQDGMRDEWELAHGLNPGNSADRNGDFDADGFTNLEDYLNDVGAFQAVQDIHWDGSVNYRYAQIENWDIAFQPSRFDTAVIGNGTVVVDAVGQHAGTLVVAPNNLGTAQLDIASGRLDVHGEMVIGGTSSAQGTLNISGGVLSTPRLSKGDSSALNFTGGTLHADVVDSHLINNGGTLAPGNSIGVTHVTGDLTLNSGVLEIEIGGSDVGEYDRVEIDGLTTLGGTLKVSFVELNTGAYVPQLNDAFGILAAYGGDVGAFDDFDLPALDPGLQWALVPGDVTTFLTIVPAPPAGDYNNDGQVDAADYVVWRKGAGVSPTQDNYNLWRTNFGEPPGNGSGANANATIPEPATLVLLMLVTAGWCVRRCRAA